MSDTVYPVDAATDHDVVITSAVTDPDDEILKPDTTAAYLRVSLPTVMTLIHDGNLKAARVGRQFRIRKSWVHEYLDRAAGAA